MATKKTLMSNKALAALILSAAAVQLSQVTAEAQSVHTVSTGETLYSIAQQYNVSADDIKAWNGLTSDTININQQLTIDTDEDSSESVAQNTDSTSEADVPENSDSSNETENNSTETDTTDVESTSNDAQESETTTTETESTDTENTESSTETESETADTTNDETAATTDTDSDYYTIKTGDTLYGIAANHGVTVAVLKEWNNLSSDYIRIGDQLVVTAPSEEEPTNPTPDPEPSETTYTVKAGDNLWAIANAYGVSVNNLRDWNNLSSDFLQIGDVLVIQEPDDAEPTPDPDPSETTYTVRAGDNLWAIANAYGVSVNNLRDWNNLSSDVLQIGDVLVIQEPDDTEPTPDPDPSETTYTVKAGDNLWAIANAYGVSVNNLRDWNNLSSDVLQIGDVLVIQEPDDTEPTPDPSETTYTVRAGDSLWAIANAHGVSVNNLRDWNNLSSDVLQIGDVLVIQESDDTEPTPDPDPSETTYTVRAGDSLWLIANTYGVTVNELKAWNNLTSNILQIGDVLVIEDPGTTNPDPSETTYTVRAGDSLWLIANAYGVTVNELKAWNNLTSNILQIGDVLVVRGGSSGGTPTDYYYTVASGDSLWLIANRYGVTVGQLEAWNNLSSDIIQPGQRLKVASVLN